jgi:serine/threonine-protein kinase
VPAAKTELRSGRYELERPIGRGAAATVWLAHDTVLERTVAIKMLSPALADDRSWQARFRREARVAARLDHPNIVRVFDFDVAGPEPYLVMAHVPGGSLQNRLENGGRPDAEPLARDLLSALAHMHGAGVIHRDIKPGNVLFERDGRALLGDFGIARPQDATAITQVGQVPGTARYMAPELWRGERATPRSDLYACGMLLEECLDDSSPPGLRALVERLRADDPERRPSSARAALDELADDPFLTQPTRAVLPAGTPAAGREPSSRSRLLALVATGAVALIIGIVLASSLGGDEEEPSLPVAENTDRGGDSGGNGDAEAEPPASEQPDAEATGSPPPAEPASTEPAAADPVALNDQGFDLIQEGRYEEAIPILEQAVAGLEGSGDITYAYALYNLGHALRLAGRPEEAIPILEQRLEIPNQRGVVAAELELAREEAGLTGGDDKPGKGPKKDKDD